MVVHDYTKVHLAKRNFAGEFKGNRVRASHTVGKAVEHVLQLCYNAVPGLFPKPVQSIRPTDWAAALMVAPQLSSWSGARIRSYVKFRPGNRAEIVSGLVRRQGLKW